MSLERDPWPDIGDALDRDKRFPVQVAIRSKSEVRAAELRGGQAGAGRGHQLAPGGGSLGYRRIGLSRSIPSRRAAMSSSSSQTWPWEWKPVLRFRVSSHMLAETSPIFARMFLDKADIPSHDMDDVTPDDLPPPPVEVVGQDGMPAKLFRMPQLELNKEDALTILLHAAHMHNDHVPRDIPFPQFVAAAEVCLRYRCTSPLEVFVEHLWLPRWMLKATDDMPDGLLLISYVFGIRRLFTRMTKTVIMNAASEKEIYDKDWPAEVKDRIRAICAAKRAQIYQACLDAVDDYLRPPAGRGASPPRAAAGSGGGSGSARPPRWRCPRKRGLHPSPRRPARRPRRRRRRRAPRPSRP